RAELAPPVLEVVGLDEDLADRGVAHSEQANGCRWAGSAGDWLAVAPPRDVVPERLIVLGVPAVARRTGIAVGGIVAVVAAAALALAVIAHRPAEPGGHRQSLDAGPPEGGAQRGLGEPQGAAT